MFHSIRWRLVASFVFVTLLTVSLIGVLALSLIRQQVASQEVEYLQANAGAVARQAASLMEPLVNQTDLQELARTSAFLSNSRIRILDGRGNTLADSGQQTPDVEYLWLPSLLELFPDLDASVFGGGPVRMAVPLDHAGRAEGLRRGGLSLDDLPPGTEYTVIRLEDSPWGARVVFERRQAPEPSATSAAPTADDVQGSDAAEAAQRTVVQEISGGRGVLGYVELSGAIAFGEQTLTTARRAFLLAGISATLLALLAGLLVSRSLSRPLSSLAAAAGQMSAGDLSVRAPVQGRDEIGQLGRQFNQMAERLEGSFAELAAERDSLRRFIADASHELRTPITALKSFNELMQGPAAGDAEARAEFLVESAGQIQRLEWITGNLLNLSRLEGGLIDLNLHEQDVGELLDAAAAPFRLAAQEKGVSLAVQPPEPPLACRCDRPRLEMALANLLDNALKFTPAGGRVEISAQHADGSVQIAVEDTGTGVLPADQPHIFERFYRGANGVASGSGLGLAIVQGIVQAHGGAVSVASQPGQGSRFVVELPGSVG
ncbi:MAG TPA: HAMP domain-containing sensor histidine kinase [Anaerolineae bacterium]|nr:HAMP domain-containing sensor histidine kinase [Anaerolineae bacterium]